MFKVAILQKRAIHAQIDKNIESIIMRGFGKPCRYFLLPKCFITGNDLSMSYEKSIVSFGGRASAASSLLSQRAFSFSSLEVMESILSVIYSFS